MRHYIFLKTASGCNVTIISSHLYHQEADKSGTGISFVNLRNFSFHFNGMKCSFHMILSQMPQVDYMLLHEM